MIWVRGHHEFSGDVADCRLYNRALSSAEVAAIYATPPGTVELTEIRDHNGLNQITRIKEGDHEDRACRTIRTATYSTMAHAFTSGMCSTVSSRSNAPAIPPSLPTYTYDALGRRMRKVISATVVCRATITNGTTDYIYSGLAVRRTARLIR
jgi:hypothetical protein